MNGRAQLARLLQEADETYTSRVKRVSVYGLADNQLPEDGAANITWQLVMDAREYGIKEITALIQKVDIQYTNVNTDTNEEIPQSFSWKLGEPAWKVDVDCSAKSFPMSLYPLSVELYMRERRIVVNF